MVVNVREQQQTNIPSKKAILEAILKASKRTMEREHRCLQKGEAKKKNKV